MTTYLILAAMLVAAPGTASGPQDDIPVVAVKAAFLYNFAKFTDWPAFPANAPLAICIVGDDGIAEALLETVRHQKIDGHPIEVRRPESIQMWWSCHELFIAEGETRRFASGLTAVKTMPVLTVSDEKGFAQTGGIIELYVEGGRTRFAINLDAAGRPGLRLSSRLLGLAKVVRDGGRQ